MDFCGFGLILVDFGGFWWILMVKPDQTEPTQMVDFCGSVQSNARSIFCILVAMHRVSSSKRRVWEFKDVIPEPLWFHQFSCF